MEIMPTQLSLEDVRVLKIQYSLVPDGTFDHDQIENEDLPEQEARVQFNFRADYIPNTEKKHLIKIAQSVELKGGAKMPFSLMIEIGGIFSVDAEPPPEELDRLRYINCNAILFPFLREVVAEISRRGGLNPIYLPPLNFVQMHKEGVFEQK